MVGFSNIADISAKLVQFWGGSVASGSALTAQGEGRTPTFVAIVGTQLISSRAVVYNPPSIPAQSDGNDAIPGFTGAALGDYVLYGPGLDTTPLSLYVQVVAPGIVGIIYRNPTIAAVNLPSSTWNFTILRRLP